MFVRDAPMRLPTRSSMTTNKLQVPTNECVCTQQHPSFPFYLDCLQSLAFGFLLPCVFTPPFHGLQLRSHLTSPRTDHITIQSPRTTHTHSLSLSHIHKIIVCHKPRICPLRRTYVPFPSTNRHGQTRPRRNRVSFFCDRGPEVLSPEPTLIC